MSSVINAINLLLDTKKDLNVKRYYFKFVWFIVNTYYFGWGSYFILFINIFIIQI